MLSPKKVKFRKQQTGRMKGMAQRGSKLNFGDFGLQALEHAHDLRVVDRDIVSAVLRDFHPSDPLDGASLFYVGVSLVVAWLLYELIKAPAALRRRRPRRTKPEVCAAEPAGSGLPEGPSRLREFDRFDACPR